MLDEAHREAQDLAAQAGLLLRASEGERARELFAHAADLERQALDRIPEGEDRTRGILAVGHVALLYKARRYDDAERHAFAWLAQARLAGSARRHILELVEAIWDERSLFQSGLRLPGEEILVSLRGGSLGAGLAPIDLVSYELRSFRNLIECVARWQASQDGNGGDARMELTTRSIFSAEHSYRFAVRLLEGSAVGKGLVSPRSVQSSIFRCAETLDQSDWEEFARLVPDLQARRAIAGAVRDLFPEDPRVEEIEIKAHLEEMPLCVLLDQGLRREVGDYLSEQAR